jgi:hypothetical protein
MMQSKPLTLGAYDLVGRQALRGAVLLKRASAYNRMKRRVQSCSLQKWVHEPSAHTIYPKANKRITFVQILFFHSKFLDKTKRRAE